MQRKHDGVILSNHCSADWKGWRLCVCVYDRKRGRKGGEEKRKRRERGLIEAKQY